eukprot:NODE_1382_length_549_cov_94.952000_g1306_i0.p2 GENE.NODE_1382_length_549_cov_94.952000_g1306_i0~~NODE_1382_length_549_cov_94.952000_g1306_i0.p2  ORF type:complete len:100 (-),score=34.71 NODE_1382_length_549_cov_94.952000_g1306_i0:250-525(-)
MGKKTSRNRAYRSKKNLMDAAQIAQLGGTNNFDGSVVGAVIGGTAAFLSPGIVGPLLGAVAGGLAVHTLSPCITEESTAPAPSPPQAGALI